MTKTVTLLVALALIAAGCNGGAQEAGPVPTVESPTETTTTPETTTTSTTGSTSTGASTPLCSDQAVKVKVDSQQGAAGTIGTTWRVTNTSSETCRSFGYPGMDFHAASGWLDVQVHRGGSLPNIDAPPARVVLDPGESLYFVSYWSDVDTDAGPCQEFDRVKVTLPDNFHSVQVASSGCLNPDSVRVGPVIASPPA
jgi:Domain of unknown function (DUF4232)